MRRTPYYLMTDPAEVARLVRENAWATWVSPTTRGLVASHYPTLLDEDEFDRSGELVLLSHFGRPDDRDHGLGDHEVLVIVQGPHGYVSPGWYPDPADVVPTWNHVTAHLWGTPEVVDDESNFAVLRRLVDEFEAPMPEPRSLDVDEEAARRIATGTVGVRLRVARFDARAKLSQNRPQAVRDRITAELRGDGPYAQPALAAEMERVRGESPA